MKNRIINVNGELLGTWEQIYNPAFKPLEFERFKSQVDALKQLAASGTQKRIAK